VNNKYFSSICKDVFTIVYPKIKSKKGGVLYHVLSIILEREESQRDDLCRYFGINQSSCLDEDKRLSGEFLNDVTKLVYVERLKFGDFNSTGVATGISGILDNVDPTKSNQSKEERQMELIITVACLMVGAFTCFKYLQRTRSKNEISPTASLCLAVPASEVYNLHEGYDLNRDDVVRLIDCATEFLCVPEYKKISVETIPDEGRSPESRLKFYVRINLKNGGNIIGKETQYGMKRELPLNVTGKVIQIGFLKNVSILREFNRI